MSKPLATKVSTTLSENVQIGPKVSIVCVATIIFQYCLNPLGHGVHQNFTGCHWSPLPLWWKVPHRPPLPSASLARQWSCWNTAQQPSLQRGGGIMLCFSMSQYMLAFMVPSVNCNSPVLAALMQPQTMTLPPPCLNVGKTHLSLYSSPGCRHTR